MLTELLDSRIVSYPETIEKRFLVSLDKVYLFIYNAI